MWLYAAFLLFVEVCGEQEQGTTPSAPRKVIAKAISPHAIQVIWRDPDLSGKDGEKESRHYIIRYKEVNNMVNGSDAFTTIRSRQLKVRINKLTPKTTYEIWVKAVKKKKASTWSKANLVTTDDPAEVYLVRNLTATPVASDAVLLSWLPPKRASKVVAYTILTQLVHGKDRQQRKDVANKEMLEYKVGNLLPNILYSFRVQTMQKRAPHPLSSEIQAQPFSDHPSGPPRDLTLVVNGSDHIQVFWQPPVTNKLNGQIVGYTLHYKHTGTIEDDIQTITVGDVLYHTLTDITDNDTYDVRIAARTVNGTGPFTGWKSVFVPQNSDEVRRTYEQDETVPERDEDVLSTNDGSHLSGQLRLDLVIPPPADVKVVNKTSSSVFLVWSLNKSPECCPVIAYKIVISNYNDSSEHEIVRGTAHVHLMSLTPRTVYGVTITALSTTGESSPSKETLFTTLEAVPPSIVLLNATSAYLGGDANLTCACQGHDICEINWYISAGVGVDGSEDNIIQITSDSDIAEQVKIVSDVESYDSLTSSVVLHKVRREAAREYVCIASNSVGSQKRQLYLPVLEPPRIITSHGTSVTTSSVARLACEAYGNPIPDIVWIQSTSGVVFDEKHDDGEIHHIHASSHVQDASQIRQSFLVVRNSSINDGGVYACVALSEAGRTESKVVLTVTVPPPGPVHKIQTIPLSPSRVSVSWLPPLNYGYSIAYYQVSYRKKHGGQPQVFNTTRVRAELYDLEHFTEYLIGVIAGTDDSLGESGPEVEVMTLTNDGLQPANVTVKALNTSIIQLDWEAPSSVSHMYIRGYNVYTRREGEDRMEKLFVRGSSSKQFLIGLGRDDTYYLKISTLMTWGHEAHSPWIRIQKPSEVYLPPGKPLNVTATAKTHGITLSWEPPPVRHSDLQTQSVQIKGYKIVYGPLDSPLNVSRATLEADIRKHFIPGLEPSTKYIISIRAFNDIGDGEPVYTRTITQASPPSMVQNAVARPVSSTEIHVQWEPPRRGQVTQYHIRYWRPGHKDKQSAWLAGNFQNYVAGSLKKRSNYRFEIIPYHGELLGEGIVIFSQTFGDKPDGPPTDVSIRSLNSSALTATWKPPDAEKANGDIIGYKLVLRAKGGSRITSFTIPGTARSYIFLMKQNRLHHSLEETIEQDEEAFEYLDIPSSRTFKFRMAAMTVNGTGVYSPWIECALSSPAEKPGPPQNLSVLGSETTLTLQWKPPQFTGSPVHGYIVGYGQFIPEVYKQILSASQTTFTIKSLKPDSEYITSVRAFNHIGESSPTFSIVRTRTTAPLITGLLAPVKLVVQSESPTSLLLSWLDPGLSSIQKKPDGRAYLIRFSPLTGETYSYINTSSLHLELSNLTPATKYEISVKIVRGNSSSSWSLPVVNSTQQIAPSSAPENIVVSPLPRSPSLISLSWSHPASPNGKIEEYIIYLTSDPTLDTKLWLVMRTEKQEVKITDIIPHTTYYFKLQARNRAGYGPLSETVAYNPPTDNRAAPTNLTVTGLYGNMSRTVKVSWSMPEDILDQITGYMVYYTNDINEDADWLVQIERGLDAVIMGLDYNKTYYFKVQARYSAAYGLFSKTVSYTTEPQTTEASPPVHSDGAVNHNNSNKDGYDNSGEYEENVSSEEYTHNHDVIVTVSTDNSPDISTVNSSIVNDVSDTVIVHHENNSDYNDVDYEDLKFDNNGDGNFSDKDNIYDNSESDKYTESYKEDYSESLLEGNLSAHPITNSTSNPASTSEVSTDVNSEENQNQLGKAESNTTSVAYEYFDTPNVSNISDLNSSHGFNFKKTSVIESTDVNWNSSHEVDTHTKSDQ